MYRRMVTWVGSLGLVGWIIGFALAGPLFAVPITFTFTSTGSGTVNGVSFTDARYTVAVKGDTAAITNPAPNRYTLYATSVTMAITGFVTATVTDTVWIFDNQKTSGLGIGRNGPGDMLDVNHEAFATYALATPLGPISGLTPSAIQQFKNVQSNLGPITLSSSSTVTFQALLDSSVTIWSGEVSIPLQINSVFQVDSENIKFKKSSITFTGSMELYTTEAGPQRGPEGCYVLLTGADGSRICIDQLIFIATDVENSRSEQLLLTGTGTMTLMLSGVLQKGLAYLDSKGTFKKDKSGEVNAMSLNGKIGGGTEDVSVLTGTLKITLTP